MNKNTLSTNEFIIKANIIHDNKYDYSLSCYQHNKIKIKIICPIHGIFEQIPNNHLNGQGCPKCGRLNQIKKAKIDHSQFLVMAYNVHGNKYEYLNEYYNQNTILKIKCKKHNIIFKVKANKHIHRKQGCPECLKDKIRLPRINTSDFIDRAIKIHGDKYNYDNCVYKNDKEKIKIICPTHGEFEQFPSNHLRGKGCNKCSYNNSKPQEEINKYLHSIGVETIIGNRKIINPYEIDIYVPSYKFGIEFHGLYYHSFDRIENSKERRYHLNKSLIAEQNHISLFQIFENEWRDKKDLIKSMINNKLKINKKIWARKCELKYLDTKFFRKFMNVNHIHGYTHSDVNIGLKYDDEVIQIIGFKNKKDYWEISRLASKQNITVVGGASKLFNEFVKKHDPKIIVTYADRRFGFGEVYKNLGFKENGITQPDYFYTDKINIFNRMKFQKHKLKKILIEYHDKLTECQNMFNNKYRRIWGAGHNKFMWTKDNV